MQASAVFHNLSSILSRLRAFRLPVRVPVPKSGPGSVSVALATLAAAGLATLLSDRDGFPKAPPGSQAACPNPATPPACGVPAPVMDEDRVAESRTQ